MRARSPPWKKRGFNIVFLCAVVAPVLNLCNKSVIGPDGTFGMANYMALYSKMRNSWKPCGTASWGLPVCSDSIKLDLTVVATIAATTVFLLYFSIPNPILYQTKPSEFLFNSFFVVVRYKSFYFSFQFTITIIHNTIVYFLFSQAKEIFHYWIIVTVFLSGHALKNPILL